MDKAIFEEWATAVPETCTSNLAKTLLTVLENKLLELNFSPELVAILRETRYMIIMQRADLPVETMELFSRTQYYFYSNYNLNLIINW